MNKTFIFPALCIASPLRSVAGGDASRSRKSLLDPEVLNKLREIAQWREER
jgi:hypothetical protein